MAMNREQLELFRQAEEEAQYGNPLQVPIDCVDLAREMAEAGYFEIEEGENWMDAYITEAGQIAASEEGR